MSASDGVRLECVSSQSEEGMITGRDGNTIPLGETGVWRLTNPFNRPGVLRLLTHSTQSSITATDQGIYTCTLPDSRDGQVDINVVNGKQCIMCVCVCVCSFDDELYSAFVDVCTCVCAHVVCLSVHVRVCVVFEVMNPLSSATYPPIILDLTYQEENRTLTCVSTVSPATTVSWMKDGQPLTTDGSSYYTLTQTVTDRNTSTYSNVLTVHEGIGVSGTYTCTVTNDLGSNSSTVVAPGEFPFLRLSMRSIIIQVSQYLDAPLFFGQSNTTIRYSINIPADSFGWRNESSSSMLTTNRDVNLTEFTIPLD